MPGQSEPPYSGMVPTKAISPDALTGPGRHLEVVVQGKYLDTRDPEKKKEKTAFKATLYYRLPSSSDKKAVDLETCVSNNISTVELAGTFAAIHGLLFVGKGTLNFNLVREDGKFFIECGGKDEVDHVFVCGSFNGNPPVLAKLKIKKGNWKEVAETSNLHLNILEEVALRLDVEEAQVKDCACSDHCEGKLNARKLNWVVKNTDTL